MIKRKSEEIGSALYRAVIFPFRRMYIERKTHSIMKQRSYLNKGSVLEGNNYIGKEVILSNTRVGYGSYINDRGRLSNTVIGKYTSIGTDVSVHLGKHPIDGVHVALHPAFYSNEAALGYTYTDRQTFEEQTFLDRENRIQVYIGNDVWIGNDVKILEGVTIGDGAVVGAGAVVTKNVKPYTVVAGIPAKKIRRRFDKETSCALLQFAWWDKGERWIRHHVSELNDVNSLLELIEQEKKTQEQIINGNSDCRDCI